MSIEKAKAILKKFDAKDEEINLLLAEDTTPEDFEKTVGDVFGRKESFYKSKFEETLPDKFKENWNESISKYNINVIKKAARSVGMDMPNSKASEYKNMDDFYKDLSEFESEKVSGLSSNLDEATRLELEEFKQRSTKLQKWKEEELTDREEFEKSVKAAAQAELNRTMSEMKFNKWVQTQRSDLHIPTGKHIDDLLEKYYDDANKLYKIDKDNKLKSHNDTAATHPEKNIIIEDLSEYIMYRLSSVGLGAKSNGGKLPNAILELGGGKSKVDSSKLSDDLIAAKKRMLQEASNT